MANALAEAALNVVVNNFREAAKLLFDSLRLPNENIEHPVFDALRKHKIMAIDLRRRLQLAVNPAVALFNAPRIPGQIEMEKIRAMRLEIQAFPSGVGCKEDTQRVFCRISIKATLYL